MAFVKTCIFNSFLIVCRWSDKFEGNFQTCPENCFERNIDKSAERMVGHVHLTLCRALHGSLFYTSLSSTSQHWFLTYIQMYRSQHILYPFKILKFKLDICTCVHACTWFNWLVLNIVSHFMKVDILILTVLFGQKWFMVIQESDQVLSFI